MEDIVYTLNNMVDDITSMYENSSDSSGNSSMEEDQYVKVSSGWGHMVDWTH